MNRTVLLREKRHCEFVHLGVCEHHVLCACGSIWSVAIVLKNNSSQQSGEGGTKEVPGGRGGRHISVLQINNTVS